MRVGGLIEKEITKLNIQRGPIIFWRRELMQRRDRPDQEDKAENKNIGGDPADESQIDARKKLKGGGKGLSVHRLKSR